MALVEERLRSVTGVSYVRFAQLLEHALKGTGKRLRPALTLLCGRFYPCNRDSLVSIATAMELLHTATLIHDDAIDNSEVRRGEATLNSMWGEKSAILVGDYLFAKSAELAASVGSIRVVTLYAHTLMAICSGEIDQDLTPRGQGHSQRRYFQRISNKTASLFAAATELGGLLGQAPEGALGALRSYGHNLGIAFQIVDDILDFIGEGEEMGKPVGSDLMQGTLTLPAILLLEREPRDNPVLAVLADRDKPANLRRAIEMVRNSSIIPECYRVAEGYCSRAQKALRRLPHNPVSGLLSDLLDYIVERHK